MDYENLQKRFDALHQPDVKLAEAEARALARVGPTVAISACLVGIKSRYDGGNQPLDALPSPLEATVLVPLCPEVLAGFGVPRSPCWFTSGDGDGVLDGKTRLVNEIGRDVTDQFVEGCRRALKLALLARCDRALLKERSPSCGVMEIWSEENPKEIEAREGGTTVMRPGRGVFAALLTREGIPLETETWSHGIFMT